MKICTTNFQTFSPLESPFDLRKLRDVLLQSGGSAVCLSSGCTSTLTEYATNDKFASLRIEIGNALEAAIER